MENLKRAKKARVDGGQWQLIRVNPSIEKMLVALGLDTSAGSSSGHS